MRVISGSKRGMKLQSPSGENVRPTLDRIKEAAFNIIQFELEDSTFLDMFSGSGQIGIEALSRGAGKVYFFEPDSTAYKVLCRNLEKVGMPDSAFISQAPFRKLGGIAPKPVFDIVYMDPPFALGLYEESIRFLIDGGFTHKDTIIVAESLSKSLPPESIGGFTRNVRRYGQVSLSIYTCDKGENE